MLGSEQLQQLRSIRDLDGPILFDGAEIRVGDGPRPLLRRPDGGCSWLAKGAGWDQGHYVLVQGQPQREHGGSKRLAQH